jgi:hypothetical protein
VTASLGGPCGAGIVVLVVCSAGLFVVGTWPAYILGMLRVSAHTQARVRRAVTLASIVLILLAAGSVVLLVAARSC